MFGTQKEDRKSFLPSFLMFRLLSPFSVLAYLDVQLQTRILNLVS